MIGSVLYKKKIRCTNRTLSVRWVYLIQEGNTNSCQLFENSPNSISKLLILKPCLYSNLGGIITIPDSSISPLINKPLHCEEWWRSVVWWSMCVSQAQMVLFLITFYALKLKKNSPKLPTNISLSILMHSESTRYGNGCVVNLENQRPAGKFLFLKSRQVRLSYRNFLVSPSI